MVVYVACVVLSKYKKELIAFKPERNVMPRNYAYNVFEVLQKAIRKMSKQKSY